MKRRDAYCSFCRKSYTDVGPLVEGPEEVYICGECVELSQAIIAQERRRRHPPPSPVEPKIVGEWLDHVVGAQDQAKQALVLAADLRNDVAGRVLLIGESTGAKILLAKAVAHALGVPFAAGSLSVANESPLLLTLLQASDFDVKAAQRGVLFVDGAERPDTQDALFRLWQQRDCEPATGLRVSVSGVLFVCGGSFANIDEAIAHSGRHVEQPVRVEDLTAAGVRPDWAGCLTSIARVAPLNERSLVRIVKWIDFDRCESELRENGESSV
jgi:ATP-dependent Clp protease ATP-binding subunit ClpX